MHSASLILEVHRLLQAGQLSQRQIAIRLGVSRGTISSIANGRRGLHGNEAGRKRYVPATAAAPDRCPGCGYRVYLPCLICRARNGQRVSRTPSKSPPPRRAG